MSKSTATLQGHKRGHTYLFEAYAPHEFTEDVVFFGKSYEAGDQIPVATVRALRSFAINQGWTESMFEKRFMSKLTGGEKKWEVETPNLVTDEGETELLNRSYNGGTFTDYVGLTDGTPSFAEGDTLSSHAGWTEVTAYSEGARQDFIPGTAAAQSLDNSGSPATFSINSDSTTIGGAFLATDSTKGGTTGTLIGGAAFDGGDKTLGSGDTLDVTITATAS